MARTHILGFPRIGARRELKFSQEAFWRGETPEAALRETGAALRRRHWQLQANAGLATVAAGDFAWYDQMLGTTALLGALPRRFGFDPAALTLSQYYELARGNAGQPAMEMTKWFDTNYHYLVPELDAESALRRRSVLVSRRNRRGAGAGPAHASGVDRAGDLPVAARPQI